MQKAAPLPSDPPSVYPSFPPSSSTSSPLGSVFVVSLSTGRWLLFLGLAIVVWLSCTSGYLMSHRLIAESSNRLILPQQLCRASFIITRTNISAVEMWVLVSVGE